MAPRAPLRCVAAYTAAMPPTPSTRSSRHLLCSVVPTRACANSNVLWSASDMPPSMVPKPRVLAQEPGSGLVRAPTLRADRRSGSTPAVRGSREACETAAVGAPKKRLVAERFQIEGEAGAGGAGTVYRALDLESGATVALKVLRGMVDTGADRFLREATTLARVQHRSVVRYVAHGVTGDGALYLAMEWLEGRDLRRHLSEEGLTLAQTVALGAELADALAAIHAMGVVHRDVKPSNVFLVGPPGAAARP